MTAGSAGLSPANTPVNPWRNGGWRGFISRLLDGTDPVARELLKRLTFYVVPNMNPDGTFLGHHRSNAAGANLNRCWNEPDDVRSPEVLHVRRMMEKTGVDIGLDVHGDEALPYNFIASPEGVPSWDDRRQKLLDTYRQALCRINPDFQLEHGVSPGRARQGEPVLLHQLRCRNLWRAHHDPRNAFQGYCGFSPCHAGLVTRTRRAPGRIQPGSHLPDNGRALNRSPDGGRTQPVSASRTSCWK